jgi:hypothetical protein
MFQVKHLNLGEILDQGIAIIKAKFGLLFAITLVTVVPLQFLTGMMQLVLFPGLAQGDPAAVQGHLGLFFIVMLITFGLSLLVFPLANAAVIHAVAGTYLSQPVTLGTCLSHGLRRWPALIGTTLLMTLVISLGFILLIIPGVIFSFWYLLAQQATVLEDVAGGAALSRSKALMKGNVGTAFVLSLMIGMINIGGSMVLGLVPQIHLNILGQSLLYGISTLFGSAVFVVFYFSCRCKLENFDLMMLADAVADEGPSTPDP